MTPRWLILVVWWAACVLWSAIWLFIRIGLDDIPPFTFAWTRLAIALTVLAPMMLLRGTWRSLRRRDVVHIASAGFLLLGVNYACVFWGAQFLPSGLTATLQAATPMLALGFGALFGSERITHRKALALTGGLAGVVVIVNWQGHASGARAAVGAMAVFAGSACVALSYVLVKTFGTHLRALDVVTIQCVAGGVPLLLTALVLEGPPSVAHWTFETWSALLYVSIGGSVVAFWMNYWLLHHLDASAMLMMGIAEVPIAIVLGAIVLGESLSRVTLAGTAAVLVAVHQYNRPVWPGSCSE